MKRFALKGFIELKTLGKGTYGSVFKARRESNEFETSPLPYTT
jgi:hypothetical protein